MSKYRNLDSDQIISTVEKLSRRVSERFPGSGLSGVARDLFALSRESKMWANLVSQPHLGFRIAQWFIVILAVGGLTVLGWLACSYTASGDGPPGGLFGLETLMTILDASTNLVVVLGAGLLFVLTFETRMKRKRALTLIHQLRSIAHVIDMHQLPKDPERVTDRTGALTSSSPEREFTAFELTRYLDYCSEMLSLTGKIAALCVKDFADSVTLSAVNEIETLTTGLSRKIWQKVAVVQSIHGISRREKIENTQEA